MALDSRKLLKSFDKLRKTLKQLPKQPTPEEIHDVRTRSRRVEATLHALQLDRKREGRRVLKAVAPVRKKAGKVRDMDVLVGFASKLTSDKHQDCLVQLLEHLGHERYRGASRLHKTATNEQATASRFLKRCVRSIERNADSPKSQTEWPADTAVDAMQLAGELAKWPKLNRRNLHEFRLKLKELRYVLQLSGKNDELIAMLGEVKDAIGEWHDWIELSDIAEGILQHAGRCEVREQIKSGADERFQQALRAANGLRRKYLGPQLASRRGAKAKRTADPVLKSAAKLVA